MENIKPADILKNNSLLNDISVAGIEKWIKDYPFASLLHSIRIKKYYLDNHPDKETILFNNSAHIPQREILSDFLKKEVIAKTALPEKKQILEKKEVTEKDKNLTSTIVKEVEKEKNEKKIKSNPVIINKEKKKVNKSEKKSSPKIIDKKNTGQKSFQGWLKSYTDEKNEKKPIKKEKVDSSSFTITRPLPGIEEINKLGIESMKSNRSKNEHSAINLDVLAGKSIELLDDHITETYAGLLAKQNKIDKAIEAYQKLSLKFPEKSSYFAKVINDLKK